MPSFLNDPRFYLMLVMGGLALWPRVQYVVRKIQHGGVGQEVRPSRPERFCLFLPGIFILFTLLILRDLPTAVALTAGYIAVFALMIIMLKRKPTNHDST